MSDYLTKPINPNLLFTTLGEWLDVSAEALKKQQAETSPEVSLKIAGLDTVAGIARVGGNLKIYTNILKKFRSHHADAAKEIKEAVEKADFESAERIAHTIKGVAGNIGANAIFKIAVELDALLKKAQENKEVANASRLETLLNELATTTTSLISEINTSECVAGEKEEGDKKEVDPAKFAELTAKLAELLEDDDSEAQECLEELMAMANHPELKEMSEMVGDYEFEEALELLQEFVKKNKENC